MTEPSFEELEQLIFLTRAYTENCMASSDDHEWDKEWAIIGKADKWLQKLKTMPISRKVELALAVLTEQGVNLDWWPGTEKVLVVSTGHVSEKTAKMLDLDAINPAATVTALIVYSKGSYGWWIYVPDEDMTPETVPEELVACLNHARKAGCKWLPRLRRRADRGTAEILVVTIAINCILLHPAWPELR